NALFFFAHGSFEASERKRSLTNDSFRASLTYTVHQPHPVFFFPSIHRSQWLTAHDRLWLVSMSQA
ncbi:MAG: hypothetical protein KZQ65_12760, partial [Candidatus Thiodiazotropha sp. (ex Gloverina cf. vestifex)]|nr:hypothetical protein [Candidatus Thiodiazotropha sp. (ex Gloverina cf. vestifex)]